MKPIKITDAEWEVMNILWRGVPVSCNDIAAEVAETRAWHLRTIRTMLDRLVSKGAVGMETSRRPFLFEPLISKQDCLQTESQSFVNRAFGGQPAAMLLHLVKHTKLKPEEIRQLKRILKEKEK